MKASRKSAMLKNREPRWMHFYLWLVEGLPVYVGQASSLEKRRKRHCQGRTVFGKKFFRPLMLESGLAVEFRDLQIRVWDRPRGNWANGIEAALVDLYGTRFPQGQNRSERQKSEQEMAALAEARRRKREGTCKT